MRDTFESLYRGISPEYRQTTDQAVPGGSYVAYFQAQHPLPTDAAFWRDFDWRFSILRGFPLALLVIAWPTLTFASLMVFRRTMRQARIRQGHVARAVLYGGDIFAFTLPALLLAGGLAMMGVDPVGWLLDALPGELGLRWLLPGTDNILLLAAMLLMLLAAWRLWRAYRHYLSFPHAAATVFASQLIVWLALVSLGGPLLEILSELL
jgi:hypothetical protein